ncbi:MAG: hypothetical protein VR72_10615 [Clostridiaceae bacterium BRH_c20a]|nr:MAG: hypothetical protein VR72_10615 [Clostridiaceae bacterium BRH_c20a]
MGEDNVVKAMFLLRLLLAVISLIAALLMFKYKTITDALRINAFVGLVAPLIFISISAIGIANMAGKVSFTKLIITIIGVLLVLYGTTK